MFQNGLLWGQSGPLFEENDEQNGGGGGTGAGDEGQSGEGGDSGDDKPVTMAQLTALLTGFRGDITKQVNAIDKKLKASQAPPPPPTKGKDEKGKKPFEDDEKEELRTRLEQLEAERQTERTSSLNKERDADVKAALSEFPWREADDRAIAFDYYKSKAERDEDGNLIIDGIDLGEYIKKHVPKRFKGMLSAREVGGSGNSNNNKATKGAIELGDIKPGMSAETDAKARETILGLYAAARAGQQ